MRNKDLTARQKKILDFLKGFIADSGYPPSLREICARFGIKSPKNAAKHLAALEKKGFIKRAAGISRAIGITERPAGGKVVVPIAGTVRAGSPHEAVEDIAGHVFMDADIFKCSDAFILKVKGSSMTGAGIEEGDYIVVRPQNHASDNDMVVAILDGEATVKRFFRIKDSVVLRPENPAHEPITVMAEGRDFSVIGKVISVIKEVR